MSASYAPKRPPNAISGSAGVQCTPNPITASGTVSLEPAVSNKISRLNVIDTTTYVDGNLVVTENVTTSSADLNAIGTKVSRMTVIDTTTYVNGNLEVTQGDFKVKSSLFTEDPTFQPDTNAALTTRGPLVYMKEVRCENVVTPTTDLNAVGTTIANHTVSIMDLEAKTALQTATVDSTGFQGRVKAHGFEIYEGSADDFLMADGSLLRNLELVSNVYKYETTDQIVSPPLPGEIRFNSPLHATTTVVWISQVTRDSADIEAFLRLVTESSVIFVQEEGNKTNFVKFTVNGAPVLASAFLTVPVTFSMVGNVAPSFGPGFPVFMSIFTDTVQIDARIVELERKTAYMNQIDTVTNFLSVNVQNNRIVNVGYAEDEKDAVNVAYLEEYLDDYATNDDLLDGLSSKLDLFTPPTPEVSAGLASILEQLIIAGAITALTTTILSTVGSYVGTTLANEGFVKKDGTVAMTGTLNMGNNDIVGIKDITATTVFTPTLNVTDINAATMVVTAIQGYSEGGGPPDPIVIGSRVDFVDAYEILRCPTIATLQNRADVIETDISVLENKTQNITASPSQTTVTGPLNVTDMTVANSLQVTGDIFTNYVGLPPSQPDSNFTHISLEPNIVRLTGVIIANGPLRVEGGTLVCISTASATGFKVPGQTNSSFLKANGGVDSTVYATDTALQTGLALKLDTATAASTYLTSTSPTITTLQNKTQNITASASQTTVTGQFRVGTITQDTSISCYAQYTQTTQVSLSVPVTQLVVTFGTSLSPFFVTTNATAPFSSFTVIHSGVYRCVLSLNGEMSADRTMSIRLIKGGAVIRTLSLSRVGTRSVEISFNELIDLVTGDVLTVTVQATDAAFTFTLTSATFNIEKIRQNSS